LWSTNLPYVVTQEVRDDSGIVQQPETGVRPQYREWPAKKVLANGNILPHTPEQKRWIEYVQDITAICSDPTKPVKLGASHVHAYTDVNVTNLYKTAHPALASILIDRCDLGAVQTLYKLEHENIHLAKDVLTRANTANKQVTDEELITKLTNGNPYNRKDLFNKPLHGMQPWESVNGWFEKLDLLILQIKEVHRIADTPVPTQCSDDSLCRMLMKHLPPVYRDVISTMQLKASIQTDVVLCYDLYKGACIIKSTTPGQKDSGYSIGPFW